MLAIFLTYQSSLCHEPSVCHAFTKKFGKFGFFGYLCGFLFHFHELKYIIGLQCQMDHWPKLLGMIFCLFLRCESKFEAGNIHTLLITFLV